MKLRKLIDKKFYTLFFITMILFVLSLVSMSLGYYRATVAGNTTSQTGTAGVLKINYAGLNELNISNAAPIYADGYKDNANHIDFTINGIDNTLNGCYNLELYVETLTDNLKDETFRWILYDNTNDIPVASGDFFNASQGDAILLLDEQDLIKDVTNINYSLYVFLENSEEKNQISMMGGSFRGKIRGIVNYKECVESTKEITFTTTPFNTVMYANGNSLQVQIVGNNIGRIICTSSNSSVATCGINQRTLTITPESVGTTVIVVRDMRTGRSLRYNITVLSTSVEVNPTSGTVYIGGTNTATATISGTNMGTPSCSSADSAIASCSITNENQLRITAGTRTGTATITVTEANGNQTATYAATTARASYTVTLDNQLATNAGTTSVTATYGLAMPPIVAPEKTGYTFGGYYTGTEGTGTQYYSNGGLSTNNWNNTSGATLYAKWSPITYTVVYNGYGNTSGSTASSSHTYDVAKALTANGFVKTGYYFSGWSTAAGISATYSNNYVVSNLRTAAGTVNLYAVWSPNANTKYVVEHYLMNTSGTYPTAATSTQNLTGTTGATLTLANLRYTTSTYNVVNGIYYSYGQVNGTTSTTTTILADGSRVIKLYYARTYGYLTINKGSYISSVSPVYASQIIYYGKSITATATVNASTAQYSYSFNGWASSSGYIGGSSSSSYTFTWPAMPSGSSITLTANGKATLLSRTLTISKGTGVSSVSVSGCSGSGTTYSCSPGASVRVVATASNGYTINSTLTSSNTSILAHQTNGNYFTMPSSNITLYATATQNRYYASDYYFVCTMDVGNGWQPVTFSESEEQEYIDTTYYPNYPVWSEAACSDTCASIGYYNYDFSSVWSNSYPSGYACDCGLGYAYGYCRVSET